MSKQSLLLAFVLVLLLTPVLSITIKNDRFKVPVLTTSRNNIESISLTKIGRFGEFRKERISFPAHLHTGIDIRRPSQNYINEPVFSMCPGKVISVRNDGPYAQIIIEHMVDKVTKIWTVYEHISGIIVKVPEFVGSDKPIARFMNKTELNKYGWQFDHCHFEILKVAPIKINVSKSLPQRHFATYNMGCFTKELLNKYYYDPYLFFHSKNNK